MVAANSSLNNVNGSADATPRLTINHDATVDLDSTNAFEGKRGNCVVLAFVTGC